MRRIASVSPGSLLLIVLLLWFSSAATVSRLAMVVHSLDDVHSGSTYKWCSLDSLLDRSSMVFGFLVTIVVVLVSFVAIIAKDEAVSFIMVVLVIGVHWL